MHDHYKRPIRISLLSEVTACTAESNVRLLSIIDQLRSVVAIVHSFTTVSAPSTSSLVLGTVQSKPNRVEDKKLNSFREVEWG